MAATRIFGCVLGHRYLRQLPKTGTFLEIGVVAEAGELKKFIRTAINTTLSRLFEHQIISTRALSELTANRARQPDDKPDPLDLLRLQLDDQFRQTAMQLRRAEIAATPRLFDRPDTKRGALSFETKYPIFNPSVVKFGDGYIFASRSTNMSTRLDAERHYASSPHCSINVVHKFDRRLNCETQFFLDDEILRRERCLRAKFGIEDIRLFVWKEAVWGIAAGVGLYDEASDDIGVSQIMFRIEGEKIAEFYQLKSPNGSKWEKNWIPVVSRDSLFFIYSIAPYAVFEFDAGDLKLVRGIAPADSHCSIRGSTQFVPWRDRFIGIAHPEREYIDRKQYTRHVFVVIDQNMNLEQISEPFFFQRKGLEFACGLANHDSGLLVSFGVMNRTAEFCILPFEELSKWVAF
jgi:hypothetical protein